MMTRKDYEVLASAIRLTRSKLANSEQVAASLITADIADALAEDNPRFDRDRFYKACTR